MPEFQLTSAQRAALRAESHQLSPVVLVGDAGLTDGVLKEVDASLSAHQLIKVRVFSNDRPVRKVLMEQICETLNAAPVQIIGKTLVVFRPTTLDPGVGVVGTGHRVVTVVKQGSHFFGKAIKRNLKVKANERVTQSGQVKRAKKRQVSSKKTMG